MNPLLLTRAFSTILLLLSSSVLLPADTRAQNETWKQKASMPLHGASACVVKGKIYVMGGNGNGPSYTDLATNEVYDPSTDSWELRQPLPTPRGFPGTAAVNDTIYVIGGGYPNETATVEAYDPATDTWTTKANLLQPRTGPAAAVVKGIIYIMGGNYDQRNCQAYDPVTNTWEEKAPIPGGSGGWVQSATVYNGLIYVFGGSSQPWLGSNTVYAYDPQTNTWAKKKDMPTPRFAAQTFLVDGRMYVMGGSQSAGPALSTVEVYDPFWDTWETLADMPQSRSGLTGAIVYGRVYVMGGASDWETVRTDVWEYDPPPAPLVIVAPLRYDFHNVRCGSVSDTLSIMLWNRSFAPMVVRSLSQQRSEFTISPKPALPFGLLPGSQTSLPIVFSPTLAGVAIWDTLIIETSDSISPRITVPLRGRGSGRVQPAGAGILYGISTSSANVGFHEIDRTSGAATFSAMVTPRPPPGLSAMTLRPSDSTLYAAFSSGTTTDIYKISSEFGDLESFTTIPLENVMAMAVSTHDHLFVVTARQTLYRIDPQTTDTFFVGSTGHAFTGLAFSPATGVLWASAHDTLWTLDPTTGNASIVGHSGWSVERSTIAFSNIGVLYGLFDNALVTIGRVWGETHSIGLTGVPGLTAIAMRSDVATDVEEERQTVYQFKLEQNYPNPFNPTTVVRYRLPVASRVRLVVYDLLGREIAVLVDENKAAGAHKAQFSANGRSSSGGDAAGLASGVYLYRMTAGSFAQGRKMLLIK